MKKKKSIVIGLAVLFLAFISCGQEDQIDSLKNVDHTIEIEKKTNVQLENAELSQDEIQELSCGVPVEVILYAGQDIEVGKIIISNSDPEGSNQLFITYSVVDSNWWLMETHLFVGDIDDATFNNSGNPQIGKFPFHGDHDLTKEFTFNPINLNESTESLSIIAHAVVVQQEEGQTTGEETAFGYGDIEFTGNRWGWIIGYDIQDCDNGENDNEGNVEDNLSGSGPEDDLNGDPNGSDETNGTLCIDSYAYHELNPDYASCFRSENSGWGWSNKIPFNDNFYNIPGEQYVFPLYESNDDCQINSGSQIGRVEISILGGDSQVYASVKYVLDIEEWNIEDLKLYIGSEAFPLSAGSTQSIDIEHFNYSLEDFDDAHTIQNVPWPMDANAYFIAYAKICPPVSVP